MSERKRALIIGAGPAGLTAAYELATRSQIQPVILEQYDYLGGIARTVEYKGNRMDIGGHRFFSKSDRVMDWWFKMMPLQALSGNGASITYHQSSRNVVSDAKAPDPEKEDRVMLLRQRKSRIFFLRKFFDYPISLSVDTVSKLGLVRMVKIGLSYMKAIVAPIKPQSNLEEFFINRFGTELYLTFFKSYTEKVWGVPCNNISAAWGAQRIKGLSILKTISHALSKIVKIKGDLRQKQTETSLIEQFAYPKLGPGQMWDVVCQEVLKMGAELHKESRVTRLLVAGKRITAVEAINDKQEKTIFPCDYVFSTMPIVDLVRALETEVPAEIKEISEGLVYRDFIAVGLLVKSMKIGSIQGSSAEKITDNWIYIHEPKVKLGRLQIFNNWSPYLVSDPDKLWLGLEYFCNESDPIWKLNDKEMIELAVAELSSIGIIEADACLDGTVVHMPKTYPAYFGSYNRFDELRDYINTFENLFLVGRNGMHKYNNQDHSMLTAMVAVDNIVNGITDKSNIWKVNTELAYDEERS